jgi:uncharacterized membrane-anchored protein
MFTLPAWPQDAHGDDAAAAEAAAPAAEEPTVSFEYQTGDVVLPNKVATLHLGERFRYLSPGEANRLLQLWGNPPDNTLQGAVVASAFDPMGEDSWAVFLTYVDDGHVDDSDAADIDYEELLQDMKEGEAQANEARREAGYTGLQLVGWAEPPHYDAGTKKLYWAKEIAADGQPEHVLNYDVRVLGREGLLSMQAVAPMASLSKVREDMKPLLAAAEFNEGYRYAEFNKNTDKLAAYGLGALVAGAAAAKLGLLAKLAPFLKYIIMGVVALGALLINIFRRKKDQAA